jgi:Cof subfamily protein (haloacid dehalogenase superfamily)
MQKCSDLLVLFSDLDGTLLDEKGKLGERTCLAVARWKENGRRLILASSRPKMAMQAIYDTLKLEWPLISYNGSFIYSTQEEKTIFRENIPLEKALKMLLEIKKNFPEYEIFAENEEGLLSENWYDWFDFAKSIGYNIKILNKFENELRGPIFKITVFSKDDFPKGFWNEMSSLFGNETTLTSPGKGLLEFVPNGVSKGKGLQFLGDYLDFPKEQCIAFGDGENDLEMIKTAGIGIAVENAHCSLKNTPL